MVFNLATEWPEEIVCEPMPTKIAGCQDLSLHEIYICLLIDDRHANVVRRYHHAQIQAEQHLMKNHEEHGLKWCEKMENEAKVQDEMHSQKQKLSCTKPHSIPNHISYAVNFEIQRFQQQ